MFYLRSFNRIILISLALLGLNACGGGSSDSASDSTTSRQGLFVDAEVEGLSFTTDSGVSGVTDEYGTYNYNNGDRISFSVGGVEIGTVTGAPKCTPTDFGVASLNIARFIQSLDADGDPTNGIDLVAANTALAGTTITSDAFKTGTAAFESNSEIAAALVTTGDTLIDAVTAQANLDAGTVSTFDFTDLEGNTYVVVIPSENDIGLITFDTFISGSAADTIFASETIGAGGSGESEDNIWSVNGSGLLLLFDGSGDQTTVTRVGGSSRAISVNVVNEGETVPFPVTLLIPQSVTIEDLSGDGSGGGTSKTYDVTTSDGTPLEVTFNSDGTFATDEPSTGTFSVGILQSNVVSVFNDTFPDEVTLFLILDGDPTEIGESVDILLVDADTSGAELIYNEIGVGSVTLK